MIYIGAEYSTQDLFNEARQLVKSEQIESFEAYKDLIDDLVEEKKGYGFFTDQEDLSQIKSDLEARWNEIKK